MTVEMESPAGGRILAHAGQVENLLARGWTVVSPAPPKRKPRAKPVPVAAKED